MRLPLNIDSVKGFMPRDEGEALYAACAEALSDKGLFAASGGVCAEIGSYCGKSAVYLGTACRAHGGRLLAVDHHRGSEENQPGEAWHDAELADGEGGVDTLPHLRATLRRARLERVVLPLVGHAEDAAACVAAPLAFVFIDGGHSREAVMRDYRLWSPKLAPAGLLALHDVFPDPADGGQAPYEVYRGALASGLFAETHHVGSLRVLRRV